jgi:putative RNase toxin 44 of polymorphic toxin system
MAAALPDQGGGTSDGSCRPARFDVGDLYHPFDPGTCPSHSPEPPNPSQSVLPTSAPGARPEAMRRLWAGNAVNQLIADLAYFSWTQTAIDIRASRAIGFDSPVCQTTLFGAHAYLAWRDYVKKDAPLDVKGEYAIRFGKSMPMFDDYWTSQLSGNLLYGFVGLSVGFTKLELSQFAGVAQFEDHCRNKHEPNAVGPGAADCQIRDLPNTWDKPADQAEIEAGFELFDRYSSLFLTSYGHRLEEKRAALKEVLFRYRDRIPKE